MIKKNGYFFSPLTSLPAIYRIRTPFPQTPVAEQLYRAFPYAAPEPRLRKVLDHCPNAVSTRKWVQYVLEDLGLAEVHKERVKVSFEQWL